MNLITDIETRLDQDWNGCEARLDDVLPIELEGQELALSIAVTATLKGQYDMVREDVFRVKAAFELVRRADRALFPELPAMPLIGREKLSKEDLSALGATCTTAAQTVDPDTTLDRWTETYAHRLDPEGEQIGFTKIALAAGFAALGIAREVEAFQLDQQLKDVAGNDFDEPDYNALFAGIRDHFDDEQ